MIDLLMFFFFASSFLFHLSSDIKIKIVARTLKKRKKKERIFYSCGLKITRETHTHNANMVVVVVVVLLDGVTHISEEEIAIVKQRIEAMELRKAFGNDHMHHRSLSIISYVHTFDVNGGYTYVPYVYLCLRACT